MRKFILLLLASHLAVSAVAQQAPQGASPAPRQPSSGLGQQVSTRPVQVVPPDTRDTVERAIQEVEDQQLSPEQIERLKALALRRQRQAATPYVVAAKPVTRTLMLNLAPGLTPPVLRLSRGLISSLVFSDLSGNPWTIERVQLVRTAFNDGRGDGDKSTSGDDTNVLSLEPLQSASYGNASVKLKGLSTPLIFTLTVGQQEYDARVDIQAPGRNPNGAQVMATTNLPNIDQSLVGFLDNVPPREARRLRTTGMEDIQAWAMGDNVYVRTNADVQYPAFVSSARSTSGKAIFRFASRPSAVTVLSGGQATTIFIEDHS